MPAAWYTAPSPHDGSWRRPLDDQPVVEEVDLEVVLVDTGEVDGHLDRRPCLGHVRGGAPARLREQGAGSRAPTRRRRATAGR